MTNEGETTESAWVGPFKGRVGSYRPAYCKRGGREDGYDDIII